MKRSITNDTKLNKKQKLSKDSKKCKIIDIIEIKNSNSLIQTPCGKFLIGNEGHSIYCYNLETKQKVRIAGQWDKFGHQDGTRDESRFNYPLDLTLSKDLKTLFVADTCNYVIRAICVKTSITTTFAGQVGHNKHIDGSKEKACFKWSSTLKLSPDGNTLIVSDLLSLRTICIATGQVDTIETFNGRIYDFTFSPDGKHIYISCWSKVLKFNFETCKSEIILEVKGYNECDLSKDGQLLFVSNYAATNIKVVNLSTNKVIDTITIPFKPTKLTISTNGKQLHACDFDNQKIIIISKYCTNFETFIQSQLSKHSFLPRSLVKRFN